MNEMSPADLISLAIQKAIPKIWESEHIRSSDPEKLKLETLGILVSRFTEWTGDLILDVAIAALHDANWHREAIQLEEMQRGVEPTEIYAAETGVLARSGERLATKREFDLADRCVGSIFEALEIGEQVRLAEGVFTLDESDFPETEEE